jgi:hypothetical protein
MFVHVRHFKRPCFADKVSRVPVEFRLLSSLVLMAPWPWVTFDGKSVVDPSGNALSLKYGKQTGPLHEFESASPKQ